MPLTYLRFEQHMGVWSVSNGFLISKRFVRYGKINLKYFSFLKLYLNTRILQRFYPKISDEIINAFFITSVEIQELLTQIS